MPVCYQFISKETNKPVSLATVDDEICEELGEKPSDEKNNPFFVLMVDIGCSSKVQNGAGEVDKEKLLALFDEHNKNNKEKVTPDQVSLVVKYLCEKYTFSAWYQRHK